MKKLSVFLVLSLMILPSIALGEAAFGVRLSTSSILGTLGPANLQGGYFGFTNTERFTGMVGFDFARFSAGDGTETSVSSIVPFFGLKYTFRDMEEGTAVPYLKVEFSKTVTSMNDVGAALLLAGGLIDTSLVDLDEEGAKQAEDFVKDLLSPFGLTFAVGGEYFFSDEFSLGGEFGFRNHFHSAKLETTVGDTTTSEDVKLTWQDTYVALTLNFIY